MATSVVIVLIFLTVASGVTAGYYVITGALSRDAQRVRKRVEEEFRRESGDSAPAFTLFKNLDQMALEGAGVPAIDLDPAAAPSPPRPAGSVFTRLETFLKQANVRLSVWQLATLVASLALTLGTLGTLFRGPVLGIAGIAVGGAAPLLYVHFRRKARREKLMKQLPAAFELMARVLRAGQSVSQSFQAVADTFEEPLAGEFAQCQKHQTLGLRSELAFHDLAEHSGMLEMRIFVMAMLIQRQVGGNLSEVLERLAALIRDRVRLRNRVRTLTAEGRLQGWTLLVLPFLVFGVMMVVNRKYAEVLFEHVGLLIATCVSMAVGVLWIRKIVNFEI